jgi:hypothetical protein
MKDRPILFSGEMVRAILEGRKTMTRRIIKPQPIQPAPGAYFDAYNKSAQWNWWTPDGRQYLDKIIKCPYGQPSDRLWVRETFSNSRMDDSIPTHYKADQFLFDYSQPWKPSIFMPRWASRILLEVADIRVERLQDIREEDAKAEGVVDIIFQSLTRRDLFAALWNKINAKRGYGWDTNPWVWVVSFKPVQKAKE